MSDELDPRWEWVDITAFNKEGVRSYARGMCRHLEVEPVETDGETAYVCKTCGKQWDEEP